MALRKKRQPLARFGPELLALVVPLGVVGVWVLLLSPAWTVHWVRTLWSRLVVFAQPAEGLRGFWSLLVTTKNTFWGCFGWVDVPLHPHVMDLLDLLTLGAVVGVAVMLIVRRKRPGAHERWYLLVLTVALGL